MSWSPPETAGDPMTEQKWVRSSLRALSARLEAAGHGVSLPALARLLRKLDYSLHVNTKKIEASSNHPHREQQFDYLRCSEPSSPRPACQS